MGRKIRSSVSGKVFAAAALLLFCAFPLTGCGAGKGCTVPETETTETYTRSTGADAWEKSSSIRFSYDAGSGSLEAKVKRGSIAPGGDGKSCDQYTAEAERKKDGVRVVLRETEEKVKIPLFFRLEKEGEGFRAVLAEETEGVSELEMSFDAQGRPLECRTVWDDAGTPEDTSEWFYLNDGDLFCSEYSREGRFDLVLEKEKRENDRLTDFSYIDKGPYGGYESPCLAEYDGNGDLVSSSVDWYETLRSETELKSRKKVKQDKRTDYRIMRSILRQCLIETGIITFREAGL